MYKDEITPILHNLFREEKGMLPNAFYEASITSDTNTRQRQYKKRKQLNNIPHKYRHENP